MQPTENKEQHNTAGLSMAALTTWPSEEIRFLLGQWGSKSGYSGRRRISRKEGELSQ